MMGRLVVLMILMAGNMGRSNAAVKPVADGASVAGGVAMAAAALPTVQDHHNRKLLTGGQPALGCHLNKCWLFEVKITQTASRMLCGTTGTLALHMSGGRMHTPPLAAAQ